MARIAAIFIFFSFASSPVVAAEKVCLTITIESSDIPGVKADRIRYRDFAKSNDCRPVEIDQNFFKRYAPKEKAIAKLKELLGDSQEILLMYSGHGVCIGGERKQPEKSGGTARGSYRLAPPVKKRLGQNQLADHAGSFGPSFFGFDLGGHSACQARCQGEGYYECENQCGLNETFNTHDLRALFEGRDLTAIIDACGSGCFRNDLLKAKSFNVMTSAKDQESTLDTPEGGILNIRLQEAIRHGEICRMDGNRDGVVSYAELVRVMSSPENATLSKDYDGDREARGKRAIYQGSSGPGSSFNVMSYSRSSTCREGGLSGGSGGSGGQK